MLRGDRSVHGQLARRRLAALALDEETVLATADEDDCDGDGIVDLAASEQVEDIRILLGRGDGTFAMAALLFPDLGSGMSAGGGPTIIHQPTNNPANKTAATPSEKPSTRSRPRRQPSAATTNSTNSGRARRNPDMTL